MSNKTINNQFNQPVKVVDYNGIKTEYVYNDYGNVVDGWE